MLECTTAPICIAQLPLVFTCHFVQPLLVQSAPTVVFGQNVGGYLWGTFSLLLPRGTHTIQPAASEVG